MAEERRPARHRRCRRWRRKSWSRKARSAATSLRERDRADIARALTVIAALGPFDVGQAAIVANNNVLAVEAAEGTDNMLGAHRRFAPARAA